MPGLSELEKMDCFEVCAHFCTCYLVVAHVCSNSAVLIFLVCFSKGETCWWLLWLSCGLLSSMASQCFPARCPLPSLACSQSWTNTSRTRCVCMRLHLIFNTEYVQSLVISLGSHVRIWRTLALSTTAPPWHGKRTRELTDFWLRTWRKQPIFTVAHVLLLTGEVRPFFWTTARPSLSHNTSDGLEIVLVVSQIGRWADHNTSQGPGTSPYHLEISSDSCDLSTPYFIDLDSRQLISYNPITRILYTDTTRPYGSELFQTS